MSSRTYTGVGARSTPWAPRCRLTAIAEELCERDWTLRTGGAKGADQAFLTGVLNASLCGPEHGAELFLPHDGFQGLTGANPFVVRTEPSEDAFEMACDVLGAQAWSGLSWFAMQAHARNMHEVLGADLVTPSEVVVCWTPGAKDVGGTRTAIWCARNHHVPVFNIASKKRFNEFLEWVRQGRLI